MEQSCITKVKLGVVKLFSKLEIWVGVQSSSEAKALCVIWSALRRARTRFPKSSMFSSWPIADITTLLRYSKILAKILQKIKVVILLFFGVYAKIFIKFKKKTGQVFPGRKRTQRFVTFCDINLENNSHTAVIFLPFKRPFAAAPAAAPEPEDPGRTFAGWKTHRSDRPTGGGGCPHSAAVSLPAPRSWQSSGSSPQGW